MTASNPDGAILIEDEAAVVVIDEPGGDLLDAIGVKGVGDQEAVTMVATGTRGPTSLLFPVHVLVHVRSGKRCILLQCNARSVRALSD
jgi:hypothetical protein